MSALDWTTRSRRRLLALAIFVSVAGLCFVIAAYGFLRSPYVQHRVIASLRQPMAEMGVELRFDEFSVDVFAGFNLVNVRLKVNKPPLITAELATERARLKYGFWGLLWQRLELKNASFKGIHGHVSLEVPPADKNPRKEPISVEKILNLIKSPPITLDIPRIDVSDVKLQLKLIQGENITEFEIKETNLKTQLLLAPNHLNFNLDASFASSGRLSLSSNSEPKNERTKSKISFEKLILKPNINVDISTIKNQINADIRVNKSVINLQGLSTVTINENGSSSSSRLKSILLNSDFAVSRRGEFDPNASPFEILRGIKTEGSAPITISGLELDAKQTTGNSNIASSLAIEQLKSVKKWDLQLDENADFTKHSIKIEQTGQLQNFTHKSAGATNLNLPLVTMSLDSKITNGRGPINFKLRGEKLQASEASRPATLEQDGLFEIKLSDHLVRGNLSTSINGSKVLKISNEIRDEDSVLESSGKIDLAIPHSLEDIHPSLAAMSALGWPEIGGNYNIRITHPRPWRNFKATDWPELNLNSTAQANIKPTQSPNSNSNVSFKLLQLSSMVTLPARTAASKPSNLDVQIKLAANDLHHSSLQNPMQLESVTKLKAEISKLTNGSIEHTTDLDKENLLASSLAWHESPNKISIEHSVQAFFTDQLSKNLKNQQMSKILGPIQVNGSHKIEVTHRSENIASLNSNSVKDIKAVANLEESIAQKNRPGQFESDLKLTKPIKIESTITVDQEKADWKTAIDGQSIILRNKAEAHGIGGNILAAIDNIKLPQRGNFDLDFGIKTIDLKLGSKANNEPNRALKDLGMRIRASLNKSDITVSSIEGGFKNGLLKFHGQGEFKTEGRGQLDGQITSSLINDDSVISGSGHFISPVKIILFDKQRLSFEATPTFDHLDLKAGDFSINNLDGSVTVLEELKIDDSGKIGFLYLKSQNPFARVDFENVEPYLEQKSQLTFDKLAWRHIEIGPMVQNFEMRQNLILLNDLKMDLLDGSLLGRFYLDLHPSRLKTGFLGRFTGIKPELLKELDRRSPPGDWAPLAGRMAVDFDLRKRLATGRMDFTTIGKKQLLSLLDVLDPDFKDNQIALARNGLRVAYPRAVGVTMDHGLMDLNIKLGGALNSDIWVRSLPLSGFINAQAGEALSTIETLIN